MKLLVTGASGLLGGAILLAAEERHEVIAVAHGHPLASPRVTAETADLAAPGVAAAVVGRYRPDAVIHTAAMTDVDSCERDPSRATLLNATMARSVAAATHAVGARLIHISTEAVFGGDDGPYAEEDLPNPRNAYGRSKLAGEQAVLGAHPEATIVRTTIYGWNAQPKSSLAEWFVSRFERGATAPGFEDAWMTPILVDDLADWLLPALERDIRGPLHVTGRECVSKADFGRRLAVAFGYDPALVTSAAMADAGLAAPRASRPCLRVEKAQARFGALPTVDDGIARFRRLASSDHRARLRDLLGGST